MTHSGPRNPNWKGGRSIASNGYVLIRVGEGHPDADVRGYAYEHKLVAQKKIGRKLKKGEQVHHRDHDKQNNDPDNLLVAASLAEHKVHHRTKGFNLRLPGEDNPLIACFCGCGKLFHKYDDSGRPREFISGHNDHPSPTVDKITSLIRGGVKTRQQIVERSGLGVHVIATALSKMKRKGLIVSTGRATYDIAEIEGGQA
jgi:hypothetical protein